MYAAALERIRADDAATLFTCLLMMSLPMIADGAAAAAATL